MVAAPAIMLLHLIFSRMRERPLVIERRAEIAHVDPAIANFASKKVLRRVGGVRAGAPFHRSGDLFGGTHNPMKKSRLTSGPLITKLVYLGLAMPVVCPGAYPDAPLVPILEPLRCTM